MNMAKGAQQYAQMNKQTGVENANPHQLIGMLYQGALDNLQQAIGCIDRNDYEGRGRHLGRVITILGGLQGFLDHKQGGEIAENLDGLYEYMSVRLYDASREHSKAPVEEVIGLLKEIKAGWDGIADQAREIYSPDPSPVNE
ncbi:MAG: flagellar export chaperone FliS [Pseudomonadales bacterium]|jgi:flagellar secretion chaperone FliS|uniref:flagellar export chaperone FliS n=1 Tax=unclassified Ketobacter TaxID=2639109 RepID=UPI000C4793E8|nr:MULTISPECIES: flagellar export chaperone FliS [unclassified Ketobacter]MAQ24983.1 flagellar export chaperone FliS [Pseudomonadales bacterium]MEC8810554.1 flagellar export chaperone FliS [Pseudomonadota bacterium]TNC87141.1 MAG: flagellar export chaperone FliS [Alcanivorax sp.]HAG96946.1 flagellar export chaperone FliS [Gammaproteobacteria bacterium]MBI26833.1 flagellar export chaperone FliS [Pseudomonadales bacterium]|tara:strand:+ start:66436 stop:66861 length:426 start_codon:yes stop_codon:yes gene_type:complete